MRNRLALTTILAAAPFFGYGRNAYAACDPSPASPTFVCTGASVVTQAITANNANVSTAPGFSVIAPAGDGITITGDGHVRFTDQNASIITGDEDGLEVSAGGDAGATAGAVTVTVNSTITGGHNGIRADNYGTGDLVVSADGKVTGNNGAGILAGVGANGRNLTVNTGAQSDVTGYNFGIDARSSGAGDLIVNANGKVTATDGEGIFAFNSYGRDLTITTGADSNVTGNRFGIRGRNDGTGDLAITVNGDVTGTVREAVYAFANSAANNLTVTVAAGSVVKGGYDGVEARSLGRGALKVAVYGEVTGTVQNGVWVVNYAGTSATVITGAGSKVTGYDGIAGRNDKGDFIITANGEVTGRGRHGIYARNTANGGKLKITAGARSNVTGYSNGIGARNEGSGDVEIIVEGKVTGEGRYGIEASNSANGGNLIITTTAGSDVTGELHGIRAGRNYGTGGDLIVTANGKVTGELADGIAADNRSPAVNLMIATGAASVITGYGNGINANNSGSGDLSITANGEVTGTTRSGITAFNSGNSKNLKIATGAASSITGVGDGIKATNSGIEDLDIDVGGRVVATNGYGIRAENSLGSFNLKITTGVASDVEGRFDAILARNSGRGTLAVAVDGTATGSIGNGVMAVNYTAGDALTIRTGATSAVKGFNGIAAQNSGRGDLAIEIGGEVTGTNFDGIYGRNFANDAKLTITTAAGSVVSGNDDGIDARMDGTGDIEIMANGLVSGQNAIRAYNNTGGSFTITVGATGAVDGIGAGIKATSTSEPVVINNSGLITATNFLAIDAKGASVEIFNSGIVRGSVNLTAQDDTFDNLAGGVFEARGAASYFGAGIDTVNNAGLVHTASGTASIENIYFDNLEFFNNSGAISLVDGLEGDQFGMGPATKYAGTGGKLIVDAFLAPGLPGRSDLLLISGSTSGTTNLVVNLTNPVGSTPNYDGIQVVAVTGTSQEGDFQVEGGVLNAGFFAWDLRRVVDVGSVTHELYTTGLGAGAYEFAAGITGAQDMWQQTTGSLLQRQADLRPAISAMQATPVADFVTPVEPTPVGRVTPGLWFKGVGGWLDRDGDADNNVTLDRKQTVFGGIAGFDFGTENLAGQGDALLFGLFGGYLTSKLSFDSTNTEWTYDGPTVGIYATYLNEAFYADAVIKADFLDIDIEAHDLAPDAEADTNATNIGGQIDLGYKFGFGQGAFIEPQASLSVLHTEIDDIDDIFGGAVEFEDETSVRGRLGLRLGADYQHDGLLLTPDVTASVWQSFTGDNSVTVFAPLTPASDVSDDPGETVGDVSLGLSVTAPEGWSGFLRGNYQFAEDFEAITGNAGLRYSW